ncbi:hypothetical protein [Methanobacterium ferruginis]|uniref:hypothetical protein n=1 Tax=Methanobacterium ferruginis TaxID=710191 RepID=UPI002573E7D0|nr:hypothetical protein [Methanobacterium ferruginis]BDZ68579.1 hypothetical protein GCM10025860_20270 [Methanobacterium ferruginis]
MDEELEGRKDQYIDNITGKPFPHHKCEYEGRWKNYFTFKEKVIGFMAGKEVANGNLRLEDEKLEKRLGRIENMVWLILLSMLGIVFKVVFGV